ncbi:hypothetical protein E2C01_019580 [Portunus trituberculatus]|uniref:Uncharacterized protein n=1 Tax=Portunus trituberculatus TaxID=210409 RepID=A0A5B7DXL5_PORTR|nr:hypothetical protein [Portunus trituberculatus]
MRNIQANTVTQAGKVKKQNEVQIIDYATKRGETLDEKQLKRVRYDVFRLGMSGFHKEKKEDTRVALAIKLGAKPPKKKMMPMKRTKYPDFKGQEDLIQNAVVGHIVAIEEQNCQGYRDAMAINYKKFQEMKKEEKKKEAEERQMKLKLGVKVPKPFKKKDKPVVKAAASQIGRYKHGVQVISKRDISKISKS